MVSKKVIVVQVKRFVQSLQFGFPCRHGDSEDRNHSVQGHMVTWFSAEISSMIHLFVEWEKITNSDDYIMIGCQINKHSLLSASQLRGFAQFHMTDLRSCKFYVCGFWTVGKNGNLKMSLWPVGNFAGHFLLTVVTYHWRHRRRNSVTITTVCPSERNAKFILQL